MSTCLFKVQSLIWVPVHHVGDYCKCQFSILLQYPTEIEFILSCAFPAGSLIVQISVQPKCGHLY